MIDKNPLIIEVTRGDMVESRHRVHAAVLDASANAVHAWGDIDQLVYPRSAIKPMQALPFIETGAADAVAASQAELALSCASHNGEAEHVSAVNGWLGRMGLGEADLMCGGHLSIETQTAHAQLRDHEVISRAHNNCSGKHSGFLATAHHLGEPIGGYIDKSHPVQARLVQVLSELGDCDLSHAPDGVDGCGIPVLGMPLSALALAAARMAAPDGLGPARAQAAKRITSAMMACPYMVAGRNRFDTAAMAAGAGAFATKTGAEGVHVGIIGASGLGVALKCEDGAKRAADVAMGGLLKFLGVLDAEAQACLADYLVMPITNAAGKRVGEVRLQKSVLD